MSWQTFDADSPPTLCDAYTACQLEAICPAGSRAVGGGHWTVDLPDFSATPEVFLSLPNSAANSWVVGIFNPRPDAVTWRVRATCLELVTD